MVRPNRGHTVIAPVLANVHELHTMLRPNPCYTVIAPVITKHMRLISCFHPFSTSSVPSTPLSLPLS